MLFSRSIQYAIQALVLLSLQPRGVSLMCRDLADGLHIPYPYLSKLMQQCARLGIVTASRGRHGGYRLLQDPERMSLLAIAQAVGGDRVTKECLLGFKECSDESACVMHCQWRPLKEGLFELLRDLSVARLADAVRDGRCRLGEISLEGLLDGASG